MNYPTFEEYNQALQFPQISFYDMELKNGEVAKTGLGLPLALCGGFALTYNIKTKQSRYAVRCFHKKSDQLEYRYNEISKRLSQLSNNYFVKFEFISRGIHINKKIAPIVKMEWVDGDTLGEFIEKNYNDINKISTLTKSLQSLSIYLEDNNIAHGDIQPGNLIINDSGSTIKLIDYDGVYVDELKNISGSELGHRNFQHPQRTSHYWNKNLDRFSFIFLDLVLYILEISPDAWINTNSDVDMFLLSANDFASPDNSEAFNTLLKDNRYSLNVQHFKNICKTSINDIPSIRDINRTQNINIKNIESQYKNINIGYISTFPVLDASNYDYCSKHIGDKVELIGKIISTRYGKAKHGRGYFFINFGDWKCKCVKINIWAQGLKSLLSNNRLNTFKKNVYISVIGLLEPPYTNDKYNYTHISITVTQSSQIKLISQNEAIYRLSSFNSCKNTDYQLSSNKNILNDIKNLRTQSNNSNTIGRHNNTHKLINNNTSNQNAQQPIREIINPAINTQKNNTDNRIKTNYPRLEKPIKEIINPRLHTEKLITKVITPTTVKINDLSQINSEKIHRNENRFNQSVFNNETNLNQQKNNHQSDGYIVFTIFFCISMIWLILSSLS